MIININDKLKKAIETNDEERVCFLVMQSEFNKKNIKQYCLLHKIARFGKLKPVLKMKEAIEKNTDLAWEPNRRNRMGRTVLHEAVLSGNKAVVKAILPLSKQIMNRDRLGRSILEDARNFPEIYLLLEEKIKQESGQQKESPDLQENTAQENMEQQQNFGLPEDKGVKKNDIESGIFALRTGNTKLFGDFVKRYRDVISEIRLKNGDTLIDYAYRLTLEHFNTGPITLLMQQKGAQLPAKASPEELYRLGILDRNRGMLQELVDRKIALKGKQSYDKRLDFLSQETAVQGALKVLSGKAFYDFFELNHDPELLTQTDRLGNTLLHTAVKTGQVYKAQYILERFPWMLNAPGFKERTPLHTLLKGKMPDETRKKMLAFLLSQENINVNALSNTGITPLDMAYEYQMPEEITQMLKQNGAKATFYVNAPQKMHATDPTLWIRHKRPFGK